MGYNSLRNEVNPMKIGIIGGGKVGCCLAEYLQNHLVGITASTSTKNQDGYIIINEISIKGADDRKKTESVLKMEGIDCRVVFE